MIKWPKGAKGLHKAYSVCIVAIIKTAQLSLNKNQTYALELIGLFNR